MAEEDSGVKIEGRGESAGCRGPTGCPPGPVPDSGLPEGDVVVDITRREDELSLMPGNAAGTATPIGIPMCGWGTRKAGLRKTALCHA